MKKFKGIPPFRRALARWALGFGVLASLPSPVSALEAGDLSESWRWRRFDREEGLPAGSISAIGHDRDDFIYAGSHRGLHRYNGFLWAPLEADEPFESGPVARIVESGGLVYAATRSEVWIARFGLELHRLLRGGRLILAAGPLGGVYAVDTVERAHFQIEKEVAGRLDEGTPLPTEEIFDYAVDDRRIHWLATREGPYRRDLSRFRWQIDSDLGPELRGRPCLRLFLLKRQAVVRGPLAAPVPAKPPSYELWALFGEPSPGAAAAAAGPKNILAQRGDTSWTLTSVDPSAPAITDLALDGGGSYLAVSEGGTPFVSEDAKTWIRGQRPGMVTGVLSGGVLDPHGYLWFRDGNAAVVRFDGQSRRWERYDRGLGLPSNNVLSILEASDGKVWAGTENGLFAFPAGPPGEPAAYHSIGDVALRSVTGLAEDRTRKVWVSSSEEFKGAFFFYENSWHRFEPLNENDQGISSSPIRRIVSDRSGDLWFLPAATPARPRDASDGDHPEAPRYRIYRYSASVYIVSTFRSLELPFGPATDLLQAQDKAYWIATDQGLLRTTAAQEDLRRYTEEQGLRSNRIWAIAEASDGAIWVVYDPSTASGVTRIRGDEVRTFDERDGLASPNARSVACTVAQEGPDTWFGTDRGILRFDGECWYSYPLASLHRQESEVWPLVISKARGPEGAFEGESVLVGTVGRGIYRFQLDDRRRPRMTSLDMSRGPDNTCTFRWDGKDFKNETPPSELRFRTRIDGEPWTAFNREERTRSVVLRPGPHTFYVEMRDLDGNTNREQFYRAFNVPALPSSLFSPVLLAALGGAGAALAVAALVVGLLLRSSRRAAPHRRALDAGAVFSAFPGVVVVLDAAGRIAGISGGRMAALGLPPGSGSELVGCSAEVLPVFQGEPAAGGLRRLLRGEPLTLEGVPLAPGGRLADVAGFPIGAGEPGASSPGGASGGPSSAAAGGGASERPARSVVLIEEVTDERRSRDLRERSRRLKALQDLSERVSVELKGADRGSGRLLDDLRRFAGAGQSEGPIERLSLPAVLDGIIGKSPGSGERESAVELPPRVELGLHSQTELWSVRGDRVGLRMALREVLQNAADAMPEGGRLRVHLRNRRITGDPGDLADGSYVEIEVEDSGPGIPPHEVPRAFDPFYSTKPRDRARGLGLSIAFGILRRHRGDIRIASAPGSGTTVTVLIPADPGA